MVTGEIVAKVPHLLLKNLLLDSRQPLVPPTFHCQRQLFPDSVRATGFAMDTGQSPLPLCEIISTPLADSAPKRGRVR